MDEKQPLLRSQVGRLEDDFDFEGQNDTNRLSQSTEEPKDLKDPKDPKKGPSNDESWMSALPDSVLVSALTIPGTHDSAAFTSKWPFVSTQNLSITEQLNLGLRYFDLRCGLRADIVEMVHGIKYLDLRLEEVLGAMYAFLDTHPTEALVVQVKHDRKDEKSTMRFSQGVVGTLARRSERWRTASTTPTLGELRGKIQLFRRFTGRGLYAYGIDVSRWYNNPDVPFTIHTWHGVQITIQDHYTSYGAEPLHELVMRKGGDVAGLMKMASEDQDESHWYVNFTSAYEINFWYQITPHEIAVGSWWGFKWEEGMNVRLRNSLQRIKGRKRFGILAMDFPELGAEDLVATVISANFTEKHGSVWENVMFVMPLVLLFVVLTAGATIHLRV